VATEVRRARDKAACRGSRFARGGEGDLSVPEGEVMLMDRLWGTLLGDPAGVGAVD
jgi:hypothetical protein